MLPLESTSVLLCLRFGIGDVVMELPVLSSLRRALPDARITALGASPAHELLHGDSRVDRLVSTSRWGLRHRWDAGTPEVRGRITRWLHAQEFDLVLDGTHATDAVSHAISRLDVRTLESAPGEEERAVRSGHGGVEAIRAGVRAGWGLDLAADVAPELQIGPEHRMSAIRALEEAGLTDPPFALSPVASHDLKQWPVERMAAVADHLVAHGEGPVLLLDGPESGRGSAVKSAMERPDRSVRLGPRHLLRTAAILERCRGFVCNDTGLMHIASAVGTPTVGVFGPTRKKVFLPPGRETVGVEPFDLECPHRRTTSLFPPRCWNEGRCLIAERSCIHRTRTQDVRSAVDEILAKRRDPPRREPRTAEAAQVGWTGSDP